MPAVTRASRQALLLTGLLAGKVSRVSVPGVVMLQENHKQQKVRIVSSDAAACPTGRPTHAALANDL